MILKKKESISRILNSYDYGLYKNICLRTLGWSQFFNPIIIWYKSEKLSNLKISENFVVFLKFSYVKPCYEAQRA